MANGVEITFDGCYRNTGKKKEKTRKMEDNNDKSPIGWRIIGDKTKEE